MSDHREDVDLRLLRTFLAVVRHGSVGGAAAAVAKTQPAVSHRISLLEKIIGRKLFSRGRSGVALTRHGEMLVAFAHRAIELNEEALAQLREESISGPVRLGLSEETVLARLKPALRRFRRAHPDVELELTVARPEKLEFLLAQGEMDFVISDPGQIAGQPATEWRSDLAWFASPDLSIDPCCPLPLVLFQNTGSWRDQILDSLRRAGWEWRIVLEGADLDATLAAVESGFGVAALLRESNGVAAIREVKHGRLPALPEVSFASFRRSSAPTRAQSLFEAALAAFLQSSRAMRRTSFAERQTGLSHDAREPERMTIS